MTLSPCGVVWVKLLQLAVDSANYRDHRKTELSRDQSQKNFLSVGQDGFRT